ncbi:hypothetical protein VNO78_23161 [Psophocarpus tetragonolobus]|uniref:Lipocalin/cytosolic fatty-acid binding domain-containing protein n=1 Tax=Psophocarpus tetragonolobus TaxID=3891 RepID=A0AAN9S4D3_PSOTE
MEVVKNLDMKRYMGRWYEIACLPSRFQASDGVNTRATYTLRDDGTVNVLNETWSGGKSSFIEGSAYNHLDDETYNQLVQKAKDEGYDVSKLHKTPHTHSPTEEQAPQDTPFFLQSSASTRSYF